MYLKLKTQPIQSMNCKNCNASIPSARVNLGFKVCVNCSDVETYGCVNIINHKTGNTIQPMSKSQAAAINKIGDRKRFGTVLKGGSKSTAYNPGKNVVITGSNAFIGSPQLFEEVGSKAMSILETKGLDSAIQYVDKEVRNFTINPGQAFKIKRVLNCIPTL